MKTCVTCKNSKPVEEFNKDKSKTDGLNSSCRECRKEIYKRSLGRGDNLNRSRQKSLKWIKENKEKCRLATARWRAAHPEENREVYRRWAAKNRDVVNANKRYRLAKVKAVTPKWANKELMREFHRYAVLMTKLSGIRWEVDHQVPIKSSYVCGFNCEANLEIIPATENLKKSNRWWPDMW